VPIESRDDVVIRLLMLGHWYTRLWPETVLTAANRAEWDPDVAELSAVLRWFANPATKANGLSRIASCLLLEIVKGNARPFFCDAVALRLLDRIDQRPDGRRIIRQMYKDAEQTCGLDVLSVPKFRTVIGAWMRTKGV
jgi:hypothetical protein